MPLYLIERQFAEKLELARDQLNEVKRVNDDVGVEWLFSFLSADKKKTYCLYQATCPKDILDAARRLDLPADQIIEVSKLDPNMLQAN